MTEGHVRGVHQIFHQEVPPVRQICTPRKAVCYTETLVQAEKHTTAALAQESRPLQEAICAGARAFAVLGEHSLAVREGRCLQQCSAALIHLWEASPTSEVALPSIQWLCAVPQDS